MVAARRVDDGVSGFGFGDQQIAVVERTDDRLDAEALQFSRMLLVANQRPAAIDPPIKPLAPVMKMFKTFSFERKLGMT
jgi:hypothetical protein